MINVNKVGTDWLNLKTHIEAEIETLRSKLESRVPLDETMFLRGQIASLRELITEVEPAPERGEAQDQYDEH